MGFLEAMLKSVLLPFAFVCMGMGTAAGFATNWARPTCSLGLDEGINDRFALKELHVQMAREDEANVVSNLRLRVDCYDNGDIALVQYIPDFFGVASGNKGKLDTSVLLLPQQLH